MSVSCGVGLRCRSDLALLWLWRRPVATAPIRSLAWDPSHASDAAQEKTERHTHTQKINAGEDVASVGNPPTLVGRNGNWYSYYGKRVWRKLKTLKIELPCDPGIQR